MQTTTTTKGGKNNNTAISCAIVIKLANNFCSVRIFFATKICEPARSVTRARAIELANVTA